MSKEKPEKPKNPVSAWGGSYPGIITLPRVLRSNGWTNTPYSSRVQYRYYDYPPDTIDNHGFRIARTKK